jgi:predicted kinase
MFFLQMSGVPGSGKSTLARTISQKTGAIVIDHDIVKSALLTSWGVEINTKVAGKVSYDMEWALIDSFLSQGQSVILDSPCLYTVMIEKGTALAKKYHAQYKYVECSLENIKEIDKRLKTRKRLVSQNDQVSSEVDFRSAFDRSKRPTTLQYLIVDSSKPIEEYIDEVIAYITIENRK